MITCGIASIPSRAKNLKLVLDSIKDQVDLIVLTLNGYECRPSFLDYIDNVDVIFADNSKGDAMKFAYTNRVRGYYLCLDDDLIVQPNYAQMMIQGVDKYNGLVSLHGRHYPHPVEAFREWIGNYRCLGTVVTDIENVDLIGSGCCAFNTSRLKVALDDFKLPNMADCWLSKLAHEQGVSMTVLKHAKDYLTSLPQKDTIWRQAKGDFTEQTKILQSYIK